LRDALHRLERRGLVRMASGRGSRAPKYRHLLAQALPLTPDEHATLCVMMLRGPQTPGELKQRAGRMHSFSGLEAVHETLERLAVRQLVARLDRRPGQKEERYAQLLGDLDTHEAERGLERMPAPGAEAVHAVGSPDVEEQETPSPGGLVSAGVDLPEASPDAGLAASPDLLATIAGLRERLARVEQEVAELRAAVATAPAAAVQPPSPRPHPGPEAATPDRPRQEWA
jgi:uncharacterized protein YceH (UPF0502 family)